MRDDRPDVVLRHAAGVIPVRPGGAILLMLRDDRPGIGSPNRWSTLGGYLEAGETPLQAARREVEEEVGQRPPRLLPFGVADGPSLRTPAVTVRSHMFGVRVTWTLDDLILGEGQMVEWFTPPQALTQPLAVPIAPAIRMFFASPLYARLAAGAPPGLPPPLDPLPPQLAETLGMRPGRLVAVVGGTAGFVRRLWDIRTGARITTSPAPFERPDVLLWWPRDTTAGAVFPAWRPRIADGGAVWVMRRDGNAPWPERWLNDLRAVAAAAGLVGDVPSFLAPGIESVRFVRR
jgi:8-oxo-dGTP diphosphatase